MKKVIGFIFLSLFIGTLSFVSAQSETAPDTVPCPDISVLMNAGEANFFDIREALNEYWQVHPVTKGSGWKPYKRWEYFWETRVDGLGNFPAPDHTLLEYSKYQKSFSGSAKSLSGTWTELGPVTMPGNGTSQPNGLGRLNVAVFHPTNANIIWAGSPSGGLWHTTDGGLSWSSNTDTLPTLGVSSIVIHPTTPTIMYLGTGDRDAGDAFGMGVFKSLNGGQSWAISNNGMGNKTVNKLIMSSANSNHLIAATSAGVYKSTDAGANWSLTSSNTANYKDLMARPGSSTIVYASANGGFYRSVDFGSNWTQISSGLPSNSNRMVIGVSAANAAYVYCLFAASDNRSFGGLYRSIDSGLSFSMQSDSPNIMGYSSDGSTTGGQAWYDICIAVDPANANIIYAGGVNIWKSVTGGTSWTLNAHWVGDGGVPAVHADIHDLSFSPLNGKLYASCDGGLYSTANGGTTWNEISSGLAIAQVYKLGQSASVKNLVINGYQDNGTAIYSNGIWTTEIGGDGMECIIDPTNTNFIYGSLYYGDIRRSGNGGQQFSQVAGDGVNGINEEGAWVTPYILHVSNPSVMIAGYNNVWISQNIKTGNPSNVTWSKISNFSGGATNTVRVLEQSMAAENTLYAVRTGPGLFRTDSIMIASPTWYDLSAGLPNTGLPTDLAAHPTNSNVVFMTLSNKVYMSQTKGASWTDISGNLPNVSMNCLVIDTTSGGGMYVGSDVGVFYRDMSSTSWIPYSSGLPAAAEVTELEIYYHPLDHTQSVVRASTYGRGLWSSDLLVVNNQAPQANFEASDTLVCTNQAVTLTDMSSFAPTAWQWTIAPATYSFQTGNANSQNPTVVFSQPGAYTVTLMATNANGSNSLIRNAFIKVGGKELPFMEDFELSANRDAWEIRNPDANISWTDYTVGGSSPGTTAMGIDLYSYSNTGQRDSLISPLINLIPYDSAILSFNHAYALYSASYVDSFYVSVAGGCSNNWTRVLAKADNGTGNFATSPSTQNPFTPSTSSDWCGSGYGSACYSIDLTPWAGMQGVRLMFGSYNGYSNNLYVDNVGVTGYNVTVSASFSMSSSTACPGDTIYFTNTSQYATTYYWYVNSALFSQQSVPYYVVPSTITSPTLYDFELIASDGVDSDTMSTSIQVVVVPDVPTAPAGPPLVCNGGNGTQFSVTPVPNAVSYLWAVQPLNAASISGQGSTVSIVFNNSFTGNATLSVSAINQCGASQSGPLLTVAVADIPDTLGPPVGPKQLCKGSMPTYYSVSPVAGSLVYQWVLYPSWAGSLSTNDTNATIDWDSSFTGNAVLFALPANTCGLGWGIPDTIVVAEGPDAPSTPGGPIQACQNSDSTIVFVSPVQFATSYDFEIDPPTAGVVTTNGNEAYINWSNSFTGPVSVRARSVNICGSSQWSGQKTITIRPAPVTPVISRSNDTLYSSEFYGNLWFSQSGSTSWTNNYFVPTAGGWYYVVVTNGYGCSERSADFWYSPVGFEELANAHNVLLFPNPANSMLRIEANFDYDRILIFNVLGWQVTNYSVLSEGMIDISLLPVGIYQFIIQARDGTLVATKLVKY